MKPRYLQPESSNRDRWTISYLDMMTILLIFFVAVAAKSQLVVSPSPSPPKPAVVEPEAVEPQKPRTNLAEIQTKLKAFDPHLDSRGLVISLPQAILFASGDDRISDNALPMVEQIADVLRDIPNQVSLVGHADFGIGDTLTTDPKIVYKEMPRFTPEAFCWLHNPNTAKFKQFRTGLDQLLQEGVIQVLQLRDAATKAPLLAAVGPLQFEVVQYRLESEYGAASRLEAAPWTVVRWLAAGLLESDLDSLSLPTGARLAYDMGRNPVILFANDWSANYFAQTNPKVARSSLPVGRAS